MQLEIDKDVIVHVHEQCVDARDLLNFPRFKDLEKVHEHLNGVDRLVAGCGPGCGPVEITPHLETVQGTEDAFPLDPAQTARLQ
jgi:hypothetical protein